VGGGSNPVQSDQYQRYKHLNIDETGVALVEPRGVSDLRAANVPNCGPVAKDGHTRRFTLGVHGGVWLIGRHHCGVLSCFVLGELFAIEVAYDGSKRMRLAIS